MGLRDDLLTHLGVLHPEYVDVVDESHQHSRGLETHFKAVVVSSEFDGLLAVARHRKVYAILGAQMSRFHALALHTYTPAEWASRAVAPDSPQCRGGGKTASL